MQCWAHEKKGEEDKEAKKKKKGVKAGEDGDSGVSNPPVLLVLCLFVCFFSLLADFLFPTKTHQYLADTI